MPPTSSQAEPITGQNYNERVIAYAASAKGMNGNKFPTIKYGSPEYKVWGRYFRDHLRWVPWAYARLEREEGKEMTVPTQWPEWFDSSFSGITSPKRPALMLVEKEPE